MCAFVPVSKVSCSDGLVLGVRVGSEEITNKHGNDNMFLAEYLDFEKEQINVAVHAVPGAELKMNGEEIEAEKDYTFSLSVGTNHFTVTAEKDGVSEEYYLNVERLPETIYKETTRPLYHFTPFRYQMNDPNGLVYDAGTGLYHLFFQCNRDILTGVDANMRTTGWGHAVTKDLVHWEEHNMALTPCPYGAAWSGSGVIDYNNTSGLFDDSVPPESRIVVFFASVYGDETYGMAKISMAYSKDQGRTFVKYPGNPVVRNPGNVYGAGLRDPKVIWYQEPDVCPEGCWMMVTCGDCHIFTSDNLIDWTPQGGIVKDKSNKNIECECPDLFRLPVDGDADNQKWVFTLGGVSYVIGHFERHRGGYIRFAAETDPICNLNGIAHLVDDIKTAEIYATQTFYNDPLGRRISISWLRDPAQEWNDKVWNSAQSVPLENKLRTVGGTLKLVRYPVEEINAVRGKKLFEAGNINITKETDNILGNVHSDCFDLVADITLNGADKVNFIVRYKEGESEDLVITYSLKENILHVYKGGQGFSGHYVPECHLTDDGHLKVRIMLDKTCYDVYGNDGEAVVQGILYPDKFFDGICMTVNGDATVNSLVVYEMGGPDASAPRKGKLLKAALISAICAVFAGTAAGLMFRKKRK